MDRRGEGGERGDGGEKEREGNEIHAKTNKHHYHVPNVIMMIIFWQILSCPLILAICLWVIPCQINTKNG